MSTANVIVARAGTGFTIDVTACDLLDDLTVKDFLVLHNSGQVSNALYTKTSPTLLTYTGASIPPTTVEVRRKTPNNVVQEVNYADRFSSDLWNKELDRIIRWREEADLNGVGFSSIVSAPIPKDDVYSAAWDGDVSFPATRNVLYDKFELMDGLKANLASPTFTGTPVAPTPGTADNSTRIATTAYVKNNLTSYATLVSPALTGSPSAPTPPLATDNTRLANTEWVRDWVTSLNYAATVSPNFTGVPTTPTPATSTNNTQIASTAYVKAVVQADVQEFYRPFPTIFDVRLSMNIVSPSTGLWYDTELDLINNGDMAIVVARAIGTNNRSEIFFLSLIGSAFSAVSLGAHAPGTNLFSFRRITGSMVEINVANPCNNLVTNIIRMPFATWT